MTSDKWPHATTTLELALAWGLVGPTQRELEVLAGAELAHRIIGA
jgi:hypothetical protein